MIYTKTIEAELVISSTLELDEQVKRELALADPNIEAAEAIVKENTVKTEK